MDTGHAWLQHPLEICASVWLWFFLVNKYCKETCLIPAQISCRFPVIQLGIGEIECWNIYQSVAYSAEGPLCMLMWSFTTRSQIKYLSHLNKKASAVSRGGSGRARVHDKGQGKRGLCYRGGWCGVPKGGGVLSLSGWRYESHLPICSFTEPGISPGLSSGLQLRAGLQQTEHGVWADAAGCSCTHQKMTPNRRKSLGIYFFF